MRNFYKKKIIEVVVVHGTVPPPRGEKTYQYVPGTGWYQVVRYYRDNKINITVLLHTVRKKGTGSPQATGTAGGIFNPMLRYFCCHYRTGGTTSSRIFAADDCSDYNLFSRTKFKRPEQFYNLL